MTADLRAALTHALQPLLPPEHVARFADHLARNAGPVQDLGSDLTADGFARLSMVVLPSPYREAAEIAEAIAPLVQAWWQSRVVEVQAGSVTVTEHR